MIVLITLALMLEAVRLLLVKNHVADHQVEKVVSTYELKKIRTSKNTSYQFILPNGDRLSVIGNRIEKIKLIESHEKLLFTYASPRGGIRFTYACVEITSVDGETCFVNREVAMREITGFMWIYFVISGSLVCFAVIWRINEFRYSKRHLKWKQKRYVEQKRKKKQAALKQSDSRDKMKKESHGQ